MANKKPFANYSGHTKELQSGDTISSSDVGMASSNTLLGRVTAGSGPAETVEYFDSGIVTYTDSETWSGTAPTGASTKKYYYRKLNGICEFGGVISYANAGTTITGVKIPLPAALPTPNQWLGSPSNNDKLYVGAGAIDTTTSGSPPASRCSLQWSSTLGYVIDIAVSSTSARVAYWSISYRY